jgi:tight adherence protein B
MAGAAEGDASPQGVALAHAVGRLRRGDELERALGAGAPLPALAVAGLGLAARQGGSRAWALDQVAATLHERAALDRELRALSSQARYSAAVVALAPLGFAGLSALVDPRVLAFLASPAGVVCVLVGAGLDGAGAWWMARIVRRASCGS